MREPSILIIGAGIGGLSTGCYAQMNGLPTTILEMHGIPGGQCTSWHRGGYTFDGCIHNLAGTTPASAFHRIWRELGVVPAIAMHSWAELVRVERPDGEPLVLYTDLDRLERHLKDLAPADAAVIEEFVGVARRFAGFDLLGLALAGPLDRVRALRMAPLLMKYGRLTLEEFAQRFTDPFLRRAVPSLLYDWPGCPVVMLLSMLGRASIGDFGWPQGGAIALARAIEHHYLGLGGEIRYHARVESILVDNDCAVGVRLADGSELAADIVVSNANGHATIFDMLGGRYTSPAIRAYYGAPEDRIEMGIHVSLGLAREMPAEPHAIVLPLAQPVTIAGEARKRLYIEPFSFDTTLAPPGKAALKVVMATSFAFWQELAGDPDRYRAEKEAIAETVIGQLEWRFSGLRDHVEVVDVATPLTTLRFTGNAHGYRTPATAIVRALFTGGRISRTLPGLEGFYMVGQWAGMPGVPMVAAMGREVVAAICGRERRPFRVVEAASLAA